MARRKLTSIERAERAKRESRTLDFKEQFDPSSAAEWPELVKDFVAMANSGGGLIVVGVCNDGTASPTSVALVLSLDPAKITDQIERYTGVEFGDFEIHEAERGRKKVAVIEIGAAGDAPLAFTKPGTYVPSRETSKQKTAFSKGTVYFRHGAKSAPGTTADLRVFIERRIEIVRELWLGRVRQVIESPEQARVAMIQATDEGGVPTEIRLTDDPAALVYGKLDPDLTHPFRQTELIDEINRQLPAGLSVNRHDVLCVRQTYGITADRHPQFTHEPRWGSQQYSQAFADWIVEQAAREPDFLWKSREKYAGRLQSSSFSPPGPGGRPAPTTGS
ncbi:MAG: putative DNA-binding domain [Solirubrobacteraceae bacterium]|jgi:hypothetical protein|nr:putative DNA-binding domain [Solirubrobacteraceae bacterium]